MLTVEEKRRRWREATRRWQDRNPDKVKSLREKYKQENRGGSKLNAFYMRRWRLKHPERVKEISRRNNLVRKDKNREWRRIKQRDPAYRRKRADQIAAWRRSNPERWNKLAAKSKLKRYHNDPGFRIRQCVSSRISGALKRQGFKRNNRTEELIGISIQSLRDYLESKFRVGMSWENYGKKGWVIDHITPCAVFDLSNDFQLKTCFHYTNLQPLWWWENQEKLDSICN